MARAHTLKKHVVVMTSPPEASDRFYIDHVLNVTTVPEVVAALRDWNGS